MKASPVVVLSLDGVVFQSKLLKQRAMLGLFSDHPDKIIAIAGCVLRNDGLGRHGKLAEILETVLDLKVTPALMEHYLQRYAASLEALLTTAPLVEGVVAFITERRHAFYLVAGAPHAEVTEQLARSRLHQHFVQVFSGCSSTYRTLLQISERHPDDEIVFFGDSIAHMIAAQEAAVAFVGVANERDSFRNSDVVKISSFSPMSFVERSIRIALHQGACSPKT